MIKRADVKIGQKLEVYRIRDGLPAWDMPPPDCLVWTEEPGGSLGPRLCVRIKIGDKLEIVGEQKTYKGISAVKVKILEIAGRDVVNQELVGYIYYGQARLSCNKI